MALVAVLARPAAAEDGKLTPEGQKNLVELGVFGGIYIPSSIHELYEYPEVTQVELSSVSLDLGGRIAYLPLCFLGLEAEFAVMPTSTETDKSALLWGIRGHLLAQYPARLAPFLVVGGGAISISSDADAQGSDTDAIFHWGIGAKFYATERILLRVDGRHMLGAKKEGGAIRAHHFEVLAGISVILGWQKDEAPADTDGDGMTDDVDKCPKEAADTPDGCPIRDSDGDGVFDDKDKCPNEAASTPDGCPIGDDDGDGLPNDKDKCPKEAAKTPDGCPIRDNDGDGILNDVDKCPDEAENKNGYQDEDGCPDEVPTQVKKFTGAIKGIKFATGKAKIRRQSFKLLNDAAKVLTDYPTLKLLIRGHTDNRGKQEFNMDLSRQRADAVKTYLEGRGIDASRLRTEGLGPDEPVADNKTRKGRAENRRIEFKLDTQ